MPDDVLTRVRERMRSFGFPGTLLPENVAHDHYDEKTGKFTVTLKNEVNLDLEGIPIWFGKKVSGTIVNGSITQMSGVKAKKGFWLAIGAILIDGEDLVFKVAGITRRVPRSAWLDND